jgi:hypothetical protein
MPVAYSGFLYVVVDLSFFMLATQTLQCRINSITYQCLRLTPNLIRITTILSATTTNTLSVCQLTANSKDLIDSWLTFSLFTTVGEFISLGSHDHRVTTL